MSSGSKRSSGLSRRLVAGLLVAVLGFSLVAAQPQPARADVMQELQDLQKQQDDLNRQIDALRNQKTRTQAEYTKVQKSIAQKLAKLKKLQQDLAYLETQLQLTTNDVSAAEQDLADAQGRLDQRQALLEARLRTMYEEGNVSYLEVLLSARDFGDFISRFELLREIVAQDAELLKSVKAEREQVAAKKAALEQKKARIAQMRDRTASQKATMASATSDLKVQQGQLAANLRQLERQEDELLDKSNELAQQISAIQARLGTKRTGKLSMVWPVIAPITSPFGNRFHPVLKKYKMHTGLDLGAKMSTPIKAAESGEIIIAGWVSGYGNTVVIDHGDGVSTLYGHQSKLAVRVGDQVSRGQIIGYVGSTGYSTGPHLHFEVRVKGQVQNPLNYLPAR